jgi:hypothetical protein
MLLFRLIETARQSVGGDKGMKSERSSQETFPDNLRRELGDGEFFYFFRRNPLKSPDSIKGIQGNARIFPCFYLDFLARYSRFGCTSGPPARVWRLERRQRSP